MADSTPLMPFSEQNKHNSNHKYLNYYDLQKYT